MMSVIMVLFLAFSILVWIIPFLNMLIFPKYVMSGIAANFIYLCILKQPPGIFTCLALLTVGGSAVSLFFRRFSRREFTVKNICTLNVLLYILSVFLRG